MHFSTTVTTVPQRIKIYFIMTIHVMNLQHMSSYLENIDFLGPDWRFYYSGCLLLLFGLPPLFTR